MITKTQAVMVIADTLNQYDRKNIKPLRGKVNRLLIVTCINIGLTILNIVFR